MQTLLQLSKAKPKILKLSPTSNSHPCKSLIYPTKTATMPRMRSVFFSPHVTTSPSPSSSTTLASSTNLYSFSTSMMHETIANAEEMINKWNPNTSTYAKVTSLFYESKREAYDFLKCVRDLQRAMHFLISEDSSSQMLVQAQNLMQIAIKRLENEFYQIHSINRHHLDPESISGRSSLTSARSSVTTLTSEEDVGYEDEIQIVGNSITEIENEAAVAVADLKAIADCMITSGYGKECLQIYKVIRKSIIDEGLYRLGIEKISWNKIQKMDWKVIELKIRGWLNAVKIAVKILFTGEKILCDHVFLGSDSIKASCFSEISREGALILFRFPELVTKSKKSPEKIFRILDLYNVITNLWPEIESIFSFESTSAVRSQAESSLFKLGESVRTLLTKFESGIQKDSSKSSVQGGGVNPLTRYAMNYLSLLADYHAILPDIMNNWALPIRTPLPESYFEITSSDSAVSARFAWLIILLLCKLDLKAELYKDASLMYLFLANNAHYIISKVRTSNLHFILGEEWISKHEIKVKQFLANYERVGWHMVLSALPKNPNTVISKGEAKNSFKRFNSAFEEAYQSQSSWIVPDSKLRDEIKVSICSKIIQAYRPFYETYQILLRTEKNVQNTIKFAPEDITNYLSDLFHGTGSSTTSSSKYPSP